jgi:ABC-type transport system substrate-binding protein
LLYGVALRNTNWLTGSGVLGEYGMNSNSEVPGVKRSRFKRLSVCTVLTILLTTVGVLSAHAGGTFRFPLFHIPTSLDPVKDELISTSHVVQQVYDGLVAFDSNLRVVPGLAESWTVSRDGKKYVFTLRKGVHFHNGNEVTPSDVVASLTRLFDPANVTSTKEYLNRIKGGMDFKEGKAGSISGISAPSDTKVMVELTEPYAPFLSVLAMPIAKVVPESMIKDAGAPLGKRPVGTGPFSFHSWADGEITLKANGDYFQGAPELEEIKFIFYPGEDRDKAFPDFIDGKLDGCPIPGSADPEALRKDGYQVLIRPRISLMFYGMNIRKPPLDDPQVRKALMLALDKDRLAREVMGSKYPPAYQILPPGMPGYSPENALAVHDRGRAEQHLQKSRYPGGKDMPELVIASVSHSDLAKRELEMFRQSLDGLGIQLKPLFVENWETFKKGIQEGRYSLYRYALYADIPDPDDLLPDLVETGASHNFTGFGNPDIDSIIRNARGEPDPVKRISMYREAERKVLDDSPLIPVIFLNVRNIDLPATGTPYLPLNKVTLADGP